MTRIAERDPKELQKIQLSHEQRRRGVTLVLGHWKIEMQSRSIVVSARGWLVVNPLGVAEPTVGWKRAPLLVDAPTLGVISDKCFT